MSFMTEKRKWAGDGAQGFRGSAGQPKFCTEIYEIPKKMEKVVNHVILVI